MGDLQKKREEGERETQKTARKTGQTVMISVRRGREEVRD